MRVAEFLEKAGIEVKVKKKNKVHNVSLIFKKRSSRVLGILYFEVEESVFKKIILKHPDCPTGLEILEEL